MRKLIFMILLSCSVVVSCNADVPFSYDACELNCTNKFNTSTNGDQWNKCLENCATRKKNLEKNLEDARMFELEVSRKYWKNRIETAKAFLQLGCMLGIAVGVLFYVKNPRGNGYTLVATETKANQR